MVVTQVDRTLRPKSFDELVGQQTLKDKLDIAMKATKQRGEPLYHLLLDGPPGLGKTTISELIAHTLGTRAYQITAPSLDKPQSLYKVLSPLKHGDILFVDEVHRLPMTVEEVLYEAMDDFKIGIKEEGHILTMPLQPFTLIGATTNQGLMSEAFRSRFGIRHTLEYYSAEELHQITRRSCTKLGVQITDEAIPLLVNRCRLSPRNLNRIIRDVRDYCQVSNITPIDRYQVIKALESDMDALGLERRDHKYLRTLRKQECPMGVRTISEIMGEKGDTVETVIEPYLLRLGFIEKTPKGRQITQTGLKHLEEHELE